MSTLKKFKLSDLGSMKKIELEKMIKVKGGIDVDDGCRSYICSDDREGGIKYCEGGSVCTSMIGPVGN